MKHLILDTLAALFIASSGPEVAPIQKEMKEKADKLDGLDIAVYKNFKLTARGGMHIGDIVSDYSSRPTNSTQDRSVWRMFSDFEHTEIGQVVSYATAHRAEILETDKDQNPTMWESIDEKGEFHYSDGEAPIEITSSHEILAFAIIMAGAFQSFNNLSLHECEHIDNYNFKQEDWNMLSRTFSAVHYTMSDWQYLAEQECTIGRGENEKASRHIEVLLHSKPLVVHCLDELLDHLGVYDALVDTQAGQQYYQIIENIEGWQNKVGSWIDLRAWSESSKNLLKSEADSLKSAITD